MKRNSLLALGFGVLLGVGLLTPGCGDSDSDTKKDASADVKKDASPDGLKGTGGSTSTGGVKGSGGATGAGGTVGNGGATGAGGTVGSGGATGTGGSGPDGGLDTGLIDTRGADGSDAIDVPIQNPDGKKDTTPLLDVGGLDGTGIDAPALDTALDGPALDTAAVEVQIDTTGLDSGEG
jgi:hypothetical protein